MQAGDLWNHHQPTVHPSRPYLCFHPWSGLLIREGHQNERALMSDWLPPTKDLGASGGLFEDRGTQAQPENAQGSARLPGPRLTIDPTPDMGQTATHQQLWVVPTPTPSLYPSKTPEPTPMVSASAAGAGPFTEVLMGFTHRTLCYSPGGKLV